MLGILFNSSIAKAYGRTFAASMEKVDGVALIRLKGRVSTDGGDLELRNLVLDALRRGERQILIDLMGVSLIDYSGVRELVTASSAAKKLGATIRLCSLSEKVLSLFQRVEILRVFDVHAADEDGLAAFSSTAAAVDRYFDQSSRRSSRDQRGRPGVGRGADWSETAVTPVSTCR